MYTVFRHFAGLKRRLTLLTPLPLLRLSRQSFHEINTGRDDENNGGGVVWGISRYYFHFYHRKTIPYEHCLILILIDAKRKKSLQIY